jgi:hypothetical protein
VCFGSSVASCVKCHSECTGGSSRWPQALQ